MSRSLREDSIAARLAEFFVANPDEELNFDDIQLKFGCSQGGAYEAVRRLTDKDLIESVRVIRLRSKGIAS